MNGYLQSERMSVFVAVQMMVSVFSEGNSSSGWCKKAAPQTRVICLHCTASTWAKWRSSKGQQFEEVSVQRSVPSGIDFETFITTGLLHDPVYHARDWEGVRPRPRPFPAGRSPDMVHDRTPDDDVG